uniref:hypothetical protein n=1 Tax=Treponema endosymbiont of Eucomonympha sp. TaxID=1580831 RepID=UPI001E4C7E69
MNAAQRLSPFGKPARQATGRKAPVSPLSSPAGGSPRSFASCFYAESAARLRHAANSTVPRAERGERLIRTAAERLSPFGESAQADKTALDA